LLTLLLSITNINIKLSRLLNHNKPAFYMLAPELFEALLEELDDKELVEIARQRLSTKDDIVTVDIDEI